MPFYPNDLPTFKQTQLSSLIGPWLTKGMVMILILVNLPLQWMVCIPSHGPTIQTEALTPTWVVMWMGN